MKAGAAARPRIVRALDFSLLILAALAIIAAMLAFQWAWGADAFIRWGGLIGFSAVFLGVFYRVSERKPAPRFRLFFWSFTGAHVFVWVLILLYNASWRLPWFALMILEVPIYTNIYTRLFPDAWRRPKTHRQ